MRIDGVLIQRELVRLKHQLRAAAAANGVQQQEVLRAFEAGWRLHVRPDSWDWYKPDGTPVHPYVRSLGDLDPPSPL